MHYKQHVSKQKCTKLERVTLLLFYTEALLQVEETEKQKKDPSIESIESKGAGGARDAAGKAAIASKIDQQIKKFSSRKTEEELLLVVQGMGQETSHGPAFGRSGHGVVGVAGQDIGEMLVRARCVLHHKGLMTGPYNIGTLLVNM